MPLRLPRTAFCLLALVALLTTGLMAPASAAPVPSVSVSTRAPIVNESVTVSGTAPGKAVRPVAVQRLAGKKWVTIVSAKSTKTGAYRLTVRTAVRATYRVVAVKAKVKVKGKKKLKAGTSPTFVLTPVQQSLQVSAPTTPQTAGSGVVVNAQARPARAGRVMTFQVTQGGTWVTFGVVPQNAAGQAKAVVTMPDSPAGAEVRVVLDGYRGAAPLASGIHVGRATPPVVPEPEPELDPPVQLTLDPQWGAPTDINDVTLSSDGRLAAFLAVFEPEEESSAGYQRVFIRNFETGEDAPITGEGTADDPVAVFGPQLSSDGQFVTYAITSQERATMRVVRSSVAGDGESVDVTDRAEAELGPLAPVLSGFEPSISGDGSRVAFLAQADDGSGDTHLVVVDLVAETVSTTDARSTSFAEISDDGRFVTFLSDVDTELQILPHRQVWRQEVGGTRLLVSQASDGAAGDADSGQPRISADGRYVVFESGAGNLVAGGPDAIRLFVRDMNADAPTALSGPIAMSEFPSEISPRKIAVSADGAHVAYTAWPSAGEAARLVLVDRASGAEIATVARDPDGDRESMSGLEMSGDGKTLAYTSYNIALVASLGAL